MKALILPHGEMSSTSNAVMGKSPLSNIGRPHKVVWSGMNRSSPSSRKTLPAKASACRRAKVKDEPQRQHQLDRQIRVASLAAGRRPPGRLPAGDRPFVDPQGQVAASLEAGFVLRPILSTVAGQRNAMTAGSIKLEWHAERVAGPILLGYRRRGGVPCTNGTANHSNLGWALLGG